MELKQMEYFVAIANAGSITEAARKLNMTQPPLTIQIQLLEKEIGVTLLDRTHRKLRLTDAGRIFYDRCATVLNMTRTIAMETLNAGKTKSFRLGLTPTTMPVVIPAIDRLTDKYPDIHFILYDSDTYQLMELLGKRVIEAAVVRTPVSLNGIESVKISHNMMMVVSRDPLPTKMKLKNILSYRLIIYRRYEAMITEAFKDANLTPNIFCVCDNARTALALAKTGKGVALLPESMKTECADSYISWIDSRKMETDILFVNPTGEQTELSQMFLNSLQQYK